MSEPTYKTVLVPRKGARLFTSGNNLRWDLRDGGHSGYAADVGCLDAPDFIPAGSVECVGGGQLFDIALPTIVLRGGLS